VYTFLTIIHVFVCVFLMLVVLLQAGRGGGIGLAFGGGGGSQSVFGSSGGATFLTKLTAVCAVIFFANSLALAYMSSQSDSRRLQRIAAQKAQAKKAEEVANAKTLSDIDKQRAAKEKDKAATRTSEAEPSTAPTEGSADRSTAPAPTTTQGSPSLKLSMPGDQPTKPLKLIPGGKLGLGDQTGRTAPLKAQKPPADAPNGPTAAPGKKPVRLSPASGASRSAPKAGTEDKAAPPKTPPASEEDGEKPAAE
jgi:preprotein translocase subunit SecG